MTTAAADDVELSIHPDLPRQILRAVVASIFLLFVQTYMVAPLIPSLAEAFGIEPQRVALLVPAYTIPYAFAALLSGALADRVGRRAMLTIAIVGFPLASLAMAASPSFGALLALRVISGIANVGIAVVGLSLVGDLFPAARRGHAIGWVFGAIAGGGAFGSTFGGLLAPVLGWRGLFVAVAVLGTGPLIAIARLWHPLRAASPDRPASATDGLIRGYAQVLRLPRARRAYPYIFLNAVFHSGVFTWLGVLLHRRYGLGDVGIGLALLGYGVPGLLLGPAIGRIVDRHGRRRIIPAGLFVAAISASLLALDGPLWFATLGVTVLSLGFDMSHPLLAGISASLDDRRRGLAMGFNTFSIFAGFGVGSLVFGALVRHGFGTTLLTFAAVQTLLGLIAIPLFRDE